MLVKGATGNLISKAAIGLPCNPLKKRQPKDGNYGLKCMMTLVYWISWHSVENKRHIIYPTLNNNTKLQLTPDFLKPLHYSDVIMSTMASQITSLTIVDSMMLVCFMLWEWYNTNTKRWCIKKTLHLFISQRQWRGKDWSWNSFIFEQQIREQWYKNYLSKNSVCVLCILHFLFECHP